MWTLDGGSTQNILLGIASLNYDSSIEALEEMNVEVSSYEAEMGRSGGGFIQMTTKSGTNTFHGAVYEFVRNAAMDSRQFLAADKQTLRRNQYGWALGCPIVKDRTFFFASQKFERQRTANPRIENIPDPAETLGDFSGLSRTILDSVPGTPVPNNIIPDSQQDPVGRAVTQFWPTPNTSGQSSRNRNFVNNANNFVNSDTMSLRVDHTLSDRHRLYGRYVDNIGNGEDFQDYWPQPVHNDQRVRDFHYFNCSVTEISNLTNKLVTENRFIWNKRKWYPTITAKDLDTPRFEAIDNRQNSSEVGGTNPVCNCPGLITWSGRDARGGSRYAHNFVYDNIEPSVGLSYRATDDCPGWRIHCLYRAV